MPGICVWRGGLDKGWDPSPDWAQLGSLLVLPGCTCSPRAQSLESPRCPPLSSPRFLQLFPVFSVLSVPSLSSPSQTPTCAYALVAAAQVPPAPPHRPPCLQGPPLWLPNSASSDCPSPLSAPSIAPQCPQSLGPWVTSLWSPCFLFAPLVRCQNL